MGSAVSAKSNKAKPSSGDAGSPASAAGAGVDEQPSVASKSDTKCVALKCCTDLDSELSEGETRSLIHVDRSSCVSTKDACVDALLSEVSVCSVSRKRSTLVVRHKSGAQGDDVAHAVADHLRETKHIEEVHLGALGMTAHGVCELASSLKGSAVKRLYLSENPIGDEGGTALVKSLVGSAVEVLSLGSCSIGDRTVKALMRAVPRCSLRRLWLSGNPGISNTSGRLILSAMASHCFFDVIVSHTAMTRGIELKIVAASFAAHIHRRVLRRAFSRWESFGRIAKGMKLAPYAPAEGEAHLQEAVVRTPDSWRPLFFLGLLKEQCGKKKEAARWYKQAWVLGSMEAGEALWQLEGSIEDVAFVGVLVIFTTCIVKGPVVPQMPDSN
eukprot:Sspe_Gene.111445::Locus_93527_Transcript_1_1_Confidence_1.000_Length_1221::g.111445::m.111445